MRMDRRGVAVFSGAVAASMMVFGSGVAAADYVGLTYADAASQMSGYGLTVVIAGRVGSELPTEQCIVTRTQRPSGVSGDNFQKINGTMLVYLNCAGAVASAGKPGNSAASPEGRQAIKAQKDYVWKSTTEDGAQWCADNIKYLTDWGAAPFRGCPGFSG